MFDVITRLEGQLRGCWPIRTVDGQTHHQRHLRSHLQPGSRRKAATGPKSLSFYWIKAIVSYQKQTLVRADDNVTACVLHGRSFLQLCFLVALSFTIKEYTTTIWTIYLCCATNCSTFPPVVLTSVHTKKYNNNCWKPTSQQVLAVSSVSCIQIAQHSAEVTKVLSPAAISQQRHHHHLPPHRCPCQ